MQICIKSLRAALHRAILRFVFDWNDLRHFLAVARCGSTVAAAEDLAVHQSTVSRRIAALELSIGASLFDKRASGYGLTDLGREILPAAEKVEGEVKGVTFALDRAARLIAGTIRLTTNELVADLFLMPLLGEFTKLYPEIRVDVVISSTWLDLMKGQADVAIRAARRLQGEDIVARKLSDLPWAIYCSQRYMEMNGCPRGEEDLPNHKTIGVEGALSSVSAFQWLEKRASVGAVAARTNSLPSVLAALRSGLGVCALPCARGESDPSLVRCMGPTTELNSSLWFVTPRKLKNEPRIRAFSSFISKKTPILRRLLQVRA